ncbi:YebG family protein [Aeromonas cavernicola]|uniref:Multidrug DMT transporter permease n=1 Tax=Aeromonas cavernicola TaxID=1006623 RepID=A0A2H9U495_9GAMM|nr:YebG family protein [Aeromonas cavernicola]PJG58840.1 multidrug DMT transporter permease [Aeromonas cavernicola]
MAVETKYVVVREGVEKMTFASKKEADAYDKLLDTADELMTLLANGPVALTTTQQEELAFYLAEQRESLQHLLKGGKGQGSDTAAPLTSGHAAKGKSLKSVA